MELFRSTGLRELVGISKIMWLEHRMFAGCHNSRNRIRGVRSQLQLDRRWSIIICWSLELLPFLGPVLVSLQVLLQRLLTR